MVHEKKKILVADSSEYTKNVIIQSRESEYYDIQFVENGPDFLKAMKEFLPHICLIELMLPQMHGIELLKIIRNHPDFSHMGVIIASAGAMVQNYQAAIHWGADYFLEKPFTAEGLFLLVEKFFAGELHPEAFRGGKKSHIIESDSWYDPKPSAAKAYIHFWGSRGSNPVSGHEYVRYGGNTSCLEVCYDNDMVIIDAGTGIRALGETLEDHHYHSLHIFLGHTHWDHIAGFPFFSPLYKKNKDITVWAPVAFEKDVKELFTDMLAHAYFPVRLDEMQAKVTFKELREGRKVEIGKIHIETHHTYHPGPTLCFKISTPNKKIGYVTDNEMLLGYFGHPLAIDKDDPLLDPHLSLIKFLSDCDLLIHEAQYLPIEYYQKVGWGHSSISNATVLMRFMKCTKWIVTHHDPKHTDSDLQQKMILHQDILRECRIDCEVRFAFDGMHFPI
ncbi:MAG: hypothetical protein Tsb0015_00060 [Simkaniaceae bacterium]